jgi:hypothetical protein
LHYSFYNKKWKQQVHSTIGITKEFTAVEFKTGGLVLLLHRSFKTNKLAANLSIFCPG